MQQFSDLLKKTLLSYAWKNNRADLLLISRCSPGSTNLVHYLCLIVPYDILPNQINKFI